MNKLLITALAIISLIGCSKKEEIVLPNELGIRLSNVSAFDFKNIKVNTSGTLVNFSDLKSNQKSEYKIFDLAYRYAYIELEVNGEPYKFQPFDYVGETPLEKGKYSYEIDVVNESKSLTINLNNTAYGLPIGQNCMQC